VYSIHNEAAAYLRKAQERKPNKKTRVSRRPPRVFRELGFGQCGGLKAL
jgi:hypothetical protein